MSDHDLSSEFRQEINTLMGQLTTALPKVIGSIDDRVAFPHDAGNTLKGFRDESLPEDGCGAAATIERLLELNDVAGANAVGPKLSLIHI